jgi:Transcriptional activator of glycolytic enzymes
VNGKISVRELNERWGAAWKWNQSKTKVEYSRRRKIFEMIEAIATKPGWNVDRVLSELYLKYELQKIGYRKYVDNCISTCPVAAIARR